MNLEDQVEHYMEIAHFELMQDYITNENGQLTDALEGELYDAMETLAVTLARGDLEPAMQQEAIANYRKAVEDEASQYANRHQRERAESMAEDRA